VCTHMQYGRMRGGMRGEEQLYVNRRRKGRPNILRQLNLCSHYPITAYRWQLLVSSNL
jgi:hypothetical protein